MTEQAANPPSGPVSAVVTVLTQTATLTASLFYFGYIRTQTTFKYLGVDVTLLGFSSVDYVLRSGASVFLPIILLAVAFIYIAGAVRFVRLVGAGPGSPRIQLVVQLGLGLLFGVTLIMVVIVLQGFVSTAALVLIVISAGLLLAATVALRTESTSSGPTFARVVSAPTLVIAAALFFLATSLQAEVAGLRVALQVLDSLHSKPTLELYSEQWLEIGDHGGVVTTTLGHDESKYRFRTTGLKLLIASDGKLFLYRSDEEQPKTIVVVPIDDTIRINIIRSTE